MVTLNVEFSHYGETYTRYGTISERMRYWNITISNDCYNSNDVWHTQASDVTFKLEIIAMIDPTCYSFDDVKDLISQAEFYAWQHDLR